MAEESLAKLCNLVQMFAENGGDIIATIDYLAIGGRPTPAIRATLYTFIVLSGLAAVLGLVNMIARFHKGSLWLFRFVHTPDGSYVSPHAGISFSLASIFSAAGCILLGFYVIDLWNGEVVHGLVLVDTIIWLPLWIGAFCIVWSTAIATLSMNRNRRNVKGGPTPSGRYFIPPVLFNILVFAFPITVIVVLLVLFNIAQRHQDDSVIALTDILGQVNNIADRRGGVAMLNCTFDPLDLIGLIEPGKTFQYSNGEMWKLVRIGFSIYTGTIFLLLVLWVPFFVAQYDILRQQIRRGTRAHRRQQRVKQLQLQLQRQRSNVSSQDTLPADIEQGLVEHEAQRGQNDNLTQLPSRQFRSPQSESSVPATNLPVTGPGSRGTGRTTRGLVIKSDTSDSSDHTIQMRGAYRALLGTSFAFAMMVLTFLGICLWIIVNPSVIASGNGSTSVLLVALGCFGILGSSVNGVNCYRAIVSPREPLPTGPGSPTSLRRFGAYVPQSPRLPTSPPLSPCSLDRKPSLPNPLTIVNKTPVVTPPAVALTILDHSSTDYILKDYENRQWGFPVRPRLDSNMTSTSLKSGLSVTFEEGEDEGQYVEYEAERGWNQHCLQSPPPPTRTTKIQSPLLSPSRLKLPTFPNHQSSKPYSPPSSSSTCTTRFFFTWN